MSLQAGIERVILEEQGLRDGIQNLSVIIPTSQKIEWIETLVEAGIKRIQIASFVHPRLVPQMADAEQVYLGIRRHEDVIYSGLVLNLRGVERAADCGMNHLACSISASNTHSQKNTRKSHAEARTAFGEMVQLSRAHSIQIRGGIQCAFGCRYEGIINQDAVYDLVKHHLDHGIDELALADSTGMANPRQIEEMMSHIVDIAGGIPIILHLHNTESKGYANVYAALKAGVRIFDTAFGGLGGCPFIKSATGNIATEDTAHMLRQMGYETDIDTDLVASLSQSIADLLGHKIPGQMYQLLGKKDIKII